MKRMTYRVLGLILSLNVFLTWVGAIACFGALLAQISEKLVPANAVVEWLRHGPGSHENSVIEWGLSEAGWWSYFFVALTSVVGAVPTLYLLRNGQKMLNSVYENGFAFRDAELCRRISNAFFVIFALSSVFYLAGQFISVPEDRLAGILGIYSQSHYTTFSGFFTLQCEGFTALFFGLIFKVAAELIREQEMTV